MMENRTQKARTIHGNMNQNCIIINLNGINDIDDLKDKLNDEEWHHLKNIMVKGEVWETNISNILYVNIPRLGMLAAEYGKKLNMKVEKNCLFALGYDLNYILMQVSKLINDINIRAIPLNELSELQIGQTIKFNDNFRTKNVPAPHLVEDGSFKMQGDLLKDPHVYLKRNDKKLILTIDPTWITTCTSFTCFKSGQYNMTGLAMVKYIDEEQVIATPYIIGIPKNPWNDWL